MKCQTSSNIFTLHGTKAAHCFSSLAQQEGKGHLYEDQQCCDPNQCMHASSAMVNQPLTVRLFSWKPTRKINSQQKRELHHLGFVQLG